MFHQKYVLEENLLLPEELASDWLVQKWNFRKPTNGYAPYYTFVHKPTAVSFDFNPSLQPSIVVTSPCCQYTFVRFPQLDEILSWKCASCNEINPRLQHVESLRVHWNKTVQEKLGHEGDHHYAMSQLFNGFMAASFYALQLEDIFAWLVEQKFSQKFHVSQENELAKYKSVRTFVQRGR